ncbi:hypothetical protein EPN90_01400 [Patescibacteria group bacterium]|nr:MAG: hypothetical protein EPN90_01400 [Patescibacteria group bacterium]
MIQNEIRRDQIENRLVIVAPARGRRPHGVLRTSPPEQHSSKPCVLCPSRLDREPFHLILPDTRGSWRIKVVDNKFPAVSLADRRAYGLHELVVETPLPRRRFENFSVREISDILSVYAARLAVMRQTRKLRYAAVYKNVGELAGSSLPHAHSQIIATVVVPPAVQSRRARFKLAWRRRRHCPYCALARAEKKGARRIGESPGSVAFAPHAAAFPFEAWILPSSHRTSLTEFNNQELQGAATLLKKIVGFLARRRLAYNVVLDELFGAKEMHLAIKVLPRGTFWAGLELTNGVIVNPISPEVAAAEYRRFFTK